MSDGKNDDKNVDPSNSNNIDTTRILRDVKNAKDIQKTVASENSSQNNSSTDSNNTTVSGSLNETNQILVNINSIRTELCRLPLNLCQREYFNIDIIPLLTVLDFLSRASYNLSASVNNLASSCITFKKESELKDTIHTVYDINKQCSEIYKELRRRIDKLLCYKE